MSIGVVGVATGSVQVFVPAGIIDSNCNDAISPMRMEVALPEYDSALRRRSSKGVNQRGGDPTLCVGEPGLGRFQVRFKSGLLHLQVRAGP